MRPSMTFAGRLVIAITLVTAGSIVLTVVSAQAEDGPHEPLSLKEGRFFVATEDGPVEITDVAGYCGKCHSEDAYGAARGDSSGQTSAHDFGGFGSSHPVEFEFPLQQSGYKPKAELDPALVLTEDRMTCLTCHGIGAARALVLPKEQGKLCVACHLM